jgi:PHP family Zn ribbon phosphoesterase
VTTFAATCPTCFTRLESATREGCQLLADSHVQNNPGHRPPQVHTAQVPW